jgi:hypothetical protein
MLLYNGHVYIMDIFAVDVSAQYAFIEEILYEWLEAVGVLRQ